MTKNVAASVHQRLLNYAANHGMRFNEVLQRYALERWLYRLSIGPHVERFVLKGALMLTAWGLPMSRPTKDIDLLLRASNNMDSVKTMIIEICSTGLSDDGLIFFTDSVNSERIAEDALYQGVRSTFRGQLGNARVAMQIDVGFSDVITPGPIDLVYPTLLDYPSPRLKAYNRESAIAEKFEAMAKLGELNSRMKDFFDIWSLAVSQEFSGKVLHEAIAQTFLRRGTALTRDAVCFSSDFGSSPDKQRQWSAFVVRSQLTGVAPACFRAVWEEVAFFLRPMITTDGVPGTWIPGGPWQS